MNAEDVIAAQRERRLGSVPMGTRLKIMLEEPVYDPVHHRWRPGPHTVGVIERPTPSELRVRLLSIEAGRTARALLEDDLLDVVLSPDHPPVVRLTAEVSD